MYYKGICLGAATISMVTLQKEAEEIKVINAVSRPHEGELRRTLLRLLEGEREVRLCVTGRKFRHLLAVPGISEPEAVELAYAFCRQGEPVEGIVSAGGETFLFYELDEKGRITGVHSGGKCASGTGEFFLQQVKRMGLNTKEALQAAWGAEPFPVAGRCSVFCKSDCTHALNKGEDKGKVVAGLCLMMSKKISELVQKGGAKRILLVGGTAGNQVMLDFLRNGLQVRVPPEAPYYEALGAALWALEHEVLPVKIEREQNPPGDGVVVEGAGGLFAGRSSSFSFRSPLKEGLNMVSFKEMRREEARPGDRLLLGLDVGSTTTKAVLIREADKALIASVYLRTSGDPVQASRKCYAALHGQVPHGIVITGLGVTGSGRQIAGLHALTPGVINEIIAHATAALYFDPGVDTILEIGGQDAKYTYIVNGVPADYAMNEACSAGTGSFLEEAAMESLDVEMTAIAPLALKAKAPPDFNDQCAAFIGSDIKTAVQEGLGTPEILGGLVYSICLNYLKRVKNNRPLGRKVFMQGGVCYNQAVPAAMAVLLEKEIIVPPEPGLMGAFGVALEVGDRIGRGLLPESRYHLELLAGREIEYGRTFTCRGEEGCDRKCTIRLLIVDGKKYPFGGACSRFSGFTQEEKAGKKGEDLVLAREKLLFQQKFPSLPGEKTKIGITRSLLVNNLYPLYATFFQELGCELILPAEKADPAGLSCLDAPFCYPVELAHGYMADLLRQSPDRIFLPQVQELPVKHKKEAGVICPLAQGEPYYLRFAFPRLQDEEGLLLSLFLEFSSGYGSQEKEFITLGLSLGASPAQSRAAYQKGVKKQEEFEGELKRRGEIFLAQLEKSDDCAVVLFGRSYNAFTASANLGIPQKFASRGWKIIPCDFLPCAEEESYPNMYWASGGVILKAARLVYRHPRLFGAYITNFSCGPDSFLVGYFREIMGEKPSLTLELDGHTSDAGLDTRIEAFLDIIDGYLQTGQKAVPDGRYKRKGQQAGSNRPRSIVEKGQLYLKLPDQSRLSLNHPRVQLLLPSMGEEHSRFLAAALRYKGIRCRALPPPGLKELKLGQDQSNCKECLPLHLTVGSLLRYLEENPVSPGEQLIYFMPDTSGPCRFGQYQVFINQMLDRLGINEVTTLSLSSDNSYGGLGLDFLLRAWLGLVTGDVMSEIYSAVLVLAEDRGAGLSVYRQICDLLESSIARDPWPVFRRKLKQGGELLAAIKRKKTLAEIPKTAFLGEIYVRSDSFSRQKMVEYLADHGIAAKVAPLNEWVYYLDYLVQKGILRRASRQDRWKNRLQQPVKRWIEKDVKKILAVSGFYDYHLTDVPAFLAAGEKFISPALTGEAILTVSGAVVEMIDEVAGAIAIGPFGCMPNRIAEAITGKALKQKMLTPGNGELTRRVFSRRPYLPFLAVETDGNVFPQVVEARLESFVLQVKRLHQIIQEEKAGLQKKGLQETGKKT